MHATKIDPITMASATILNRVPKEKLAQVLSHILEKRSASLAADGAVFTDEEVQHLVALLRMSTSEIASVVDASTSVFVEAAVFGDVVPTVLEAEGVRSDVIATINKVWRKKGRAVAEKLMQSVPLDLTRALKQTQWQLQVQLGQRYVKNKTDPVTIFQMHTEDRMGNKEKMDIEMNHAELFGFFQQLNAIQAELDKAAP